MKCSGWVVSCLSFGLVAAAGCSHSSSGGQSNAAAPDNESASFAREDAGVATPRLKGAAVGNYNHGYVDGVNASAFFNKGQPLTDEQVDRLIEIGRRQGDPTGLLAQNGYPDGYRAGAKHAHNPYEKQMTAEQVAQVRKAEGLPPEPVQTAQPKDAQASASNTDKKQRAADHTSKSTKKKESATASARD